MILAWRELMSIERNELKGKVAIVTGGARGIGRAIASKLAEEGVSVVVADREATSAKKTADFLRKKGGRAIAIVTDVSDKDSVEAMVKRTVEEWKKVEILVNNAGIMFRTRLLNISLEEWDEVLRVNLTGPFLTIRAVLPLMKKQGFGRIINISSLAGRSVSTLGGAHYTSSKAGLLGLTRAVAKEMAPFGITVNAICPGLIRTRMVKDTTSKEELERVVNSIPLERIGLPEEIGDLVVFLCSEKASYVTGASIDINGGSLMI